MLTIHCAKQKGLSPLEFNTLYNIIVKAYADTESEMWGENYVRVSEIFFKEFIEKEEVLVAFLDNEVVAETNGSGSAQANGVLVEGSAALIGAAGAIYSAGSNSGALPVTWALTFEVNGQEVLVRLNGAAGDTVQWDAKVNIVYRG